jgi:hypothetical protein
LATPISGTQTLGTVQVPIPAGAQIGQTYTVTITGASGSSAGTPVSLGAGANATVLLSNNYLVGDVYPYTSTDPDGGNSAGEFGYGNLTTYGTLDLIYTLRQAVSTPGYTVPTTCDRFDAMDSYPVDTVNTRGGNGIVDNLDLIETLARVTNIDTSRPTRGTRGSTCPSITSQSPDSAAPASRKTPDSPTAAWLEMGPARGDGSVPIYLSNDATLPLLGLSFSVGADDPSKPTLTFVAADGFNPTLTDNGVAGLLAVAWLKGIYATPGRTLLGYVQGTGGGELTFGVVVANTRDGGTPRIDFRRAR